MIVWDWNHRAIMFIQKGNLNCLVLQSYLLSWAIMSVQQGKHNCEGMQSYMSSRAIIFVELVNHICRVGQSYLSSYAYSSYLLRRETYLSSWSIIFVEQGNQLTLSPLLSSACSRSLCLYSASASNSLRKRFNAKTALLQIFRYVVCCQCIQSFSYWPRESLFYQKVQSK